MRSVFFLFFLLFSLKSHAGDTDEIGPKEEGRPSRLLPLLPDKSTALESASSSYFFGDLGSPEGTPSVTSKTDEYQGQSSTSQNQDTAPYGLESSKLALRWSTYPRASLPKAPKGSPTTQKGSPTTPTQATEGEAITVSS